MYIRYEFDRSEHRRYQEILMFHQTYDMCDHLKLQTSIAVWRETQLVGCDEWFIIIGTGGTSLLFYLLN